MIKQESIDKLKDSLDIVDVVGNYITLKKNGSGLEACCPFHEEKSPSFRVNQKEQFYKCFGCGKVGDAIQFVMDHKSLGFQEAVKEIAQITNFVLEFTEAKKDEFKDKKAQAIDLNNAALKIYNKKLSKAPAAIEYLKERGITGEDCLTWDIGYVPKTYRTVTDYAVQNGLLQVAIDTGIVKEKEDGENVKHHDMFINRLMIGVRNYRGELIGWGGRLIEGDGPKYINSNSSYIYDKGAMLYGLDKAADHIKTYDTAILVEGYFDVISAHKAGMPIAVAVNNKALSDAQAVILAKRCSSVVLAFDNEEKTIDTTMVAIEKLITAGVKFVYVYKYPDGVNDFDDLAKAGYLTNVKELKNDQSTDALVWMSQILKDRIENPYDQEKAYDKICGVIAQIESTIVQDSCIDKVHKVFGGKKKYLTDKMKGAVDAKTTNTLGEFEIDPDVTFSVPQGVDTNFYIEHGYYPLNDSLKTGYYFSKGQGKNQERVSNFTMEPLFHLYSLNSDENKRIVKVNNGIGQKDKVMEIRSDDLASADKLKNVMMREGNYLFYGNTPHLMRINTVMMQKFPTCWELLRLGQQKEGFFAFADKVYYDGNLINYDKYGIVQIDGVYYYSPSCSEIYKHLRSDSDAYKNDREINYCESPIGLTQWMELLINVYGKQSRMGIAYCIVSIFRDLVFKIDNNCPHLYGYGQSKSGKSKFMESLLALFYKNINAYNLNSGTTASFSAHMSRYANCPAPFNELDEKTINEDWFQILKTAYDGEGRKRMDMKKMGKIEEQEVVSTLMLIGQYLVTKDDNSLLSRSIVLPFHIQKYTEKQSQQYNELKNIEEQGMNSLLLEFLKLRTDFEEKYYAFFHDSFKKVRTYFTKNDIDFNERVARNYTALLACVDLAADCGIVFPFTIDEFFQDCTEEIEKLSALISNSDSTAIFWQRMEEMVSDGDITQGVDYRILVHDGEFVANIDGKDKTYVFDAPKKILALRLRTHIHSKYMKKCKDIGGEKAQPYETLKHYLTKSDLYIGTKNSVSFNNISIDKANPHKVKKVRSVTRAFLLDYDMLESRGINLEIFADEDEEFMLKDVPAAVTDTDEDKLPF